MASQFPKTTTYVHSGTGLLVELNKMKKEHPSLKDVEIALIFNPSPSDPLPKAFNTRLFNAFLGVTVEHILRVLFEQFKGNASRLPAESLKPFAKFPLYLHYLRTGSGSDEKITFHTQPSDGFGERYVLHTCTDLTILHREEFAAQQGSSISECHRA